MHYLDASSLYINTYNNHSYIFKYISYILTYFSNRYYC